MENYNIRINVRYTLNRSIDRFNKIHIKMAMSILDSLVANG